MTVQIELSGASDLSDPRSRVLAAEAAVRAICQAAGQDPADGTMVLLTAAVHLARQYMKPGTDITMVLAENLGYAIVAADDFFKLRPAPPTTPKP